MADALKAALEGGAGLGLAITRQAEELNGGRIGLWSKADSYVFFNKFTISER
ncbi:hypothetical protein KP004_20835 [Geomonas oryzisoli]|uniref:Sensor histidine kinase n=1 Tax=Geomonas oryzisoli TaxID=2847992 RepID=A0ABX8J932_9BACT|nr:hypothetical protein [Geomonas oryzisoli]QWV93571.1 hypothetical protein KP004_20835 [Geomonas oryzisoli]